VATYMTLGRFMSGWNKKCTCVYFLKFSFIHQCQQENKNKNKNSDLKSNICMLTLLQESTKRNLWEKNKKRIPYDSNHVYKLKYLSFFSWIFNKLVILVKILPSSCISYNLSILAFNLPGVVIRSIDPLALHYPQVTELFFKELIIRFYL